jgi:tetratricopeptide (TPR) repeat protein
MARDERIDAPAVGPRLRHLLRAVFALVALLGANSMYLGAARVLQAVQQRPYQDYFYQWMFLLHLILGLLVIAPFLIFGLAHMHKALPRPKRRAVYAGLALFSFALLNVVSGLVLVRFAFLDVGAADLRNAAYWVHILTPFIIVWLFVLHRLAGPAVRWKIGAAWGAFAGAVTLVMLAAQVRDPSRQDADASAAVRDFTPSLARVRGSDGVIPSRALMMNEYCGECHVDTHARWAQSVHRFSSFNNPAYLFSIRETRRVLLARDGNVEASRFCAGCHDPVPLFSGRFDDPSFDLGAPTAEAGITCIACHGITAINSPRGNADYVIEEPAHYPFVDSENRLLRWLNRQLIRANPDFHKRTFLKPLHKTPEFCGTCHKVHLPAALNAYKWLRGQNHYDSYQLSGVSGHGVASFYYPPKAIHRCSECHMPRMASHDPGARLYDDAGILQVHDHLFASANTAIPSLLEMPEWVHTAHRESLDAILRIDIFGLRDDGTISGRLRAPIRPDLPVLVPGGTYLLDIVIRTLKLGHLFTEGTADSNEVWMDVALRSGDRVIGRSGATAADGTVDPWSFFANAYVLDRDGARIDRRNVQDIFVPLYNHQIPPGAADVVHYRFTVPADVRSEIVVEAKLQYRKFDTRFVEHFSADEFARNELPITTLAADVVSLPIAPGPVKGVGESPIPAWERWNDYGIGLLLNGPETSKGELRQAEEAFRQVEAMGNPNGPVNLGRVYFTEGRLDDAVAALRRAAEHEPAAVPWVTEWLSGLVNFQNGYLQEAADGFRSLVHTEFADARRREFDFSQDYRLLGTLGQTIFEQAKRERDPERHAERDRLLREAAAWFERALVLDPENLAAHYNLALIYDRLGRTAVAERHHTLHETYKPDDNARDRAITAHRRANPPADHAAEAVVIYDLRPPNPPRIAQVPTRAIR